MKTFGLKLLFFIFGFWIISYALTGIANNLAPIQVYDESETQALHTLLENKDTVQSISIGNSHSAAIDFATFGLRGQNLARAGTDLFEVELYSRSVVPQLPKLETVFISVSYFSFSNNNVLLDDTRNLRISLYSILPSWKPLPGDLDAFLLGKFNRYFHVMSIARPDNWENVFTNALERKRPVEYAPAWSMKTKTPWGECAHFSAQEIDEIGKDIGYKAATSYLRYKEIDPSIPLKSKQALINTIQMIQARGVRVVLFTPPYHQSYNERFQETAPEIIESMRNTLDEIQAKTGVEYYDAAALPQFSTRPELFYNSDHLNQCGMRAFSAYLKEKMEKETKSVNHQPPGSKR